MTNMPTLPPQERELDLALSQDQVLLGDSVARFLKNEVGPSALCQMAEQPDMSTELWKKFTALGVCGLVVAESHGGAGLGLADLVVVAEKCGAAALPLPFLSHACAALAL